MEISKIFSTFYQGCTQKASSLAESTIGKIVGSVLKFSYRVINPFSAQSTLKHRSISAVLFAGGAAAAVMYFKNKNKPANAAVPTFQQQGTDHATYAEPNNAELTQPDTTALTPTTQE
jgi:hypothetical protein